MSAPRILVAGIGNIFLGDDAFGVEVVRSMARQPPPPGVRVVDFGIRGLDLAYALLEGYDGAVFVDALCRGGEPGTLYVLEPDVGPATGPGPPVVEGHVLDPVSVLRLVRTLGGQLPTLRIVGCEPATIAPAEDGRAALSGPVGAAVPAAVALIEALIREWPGREAAPCTNSGSPRKSSTS